MLPLVIFDGDCQGQHLAAILSKSGIADAYAVGGDLGFVPSHEGRACSYVNASELPQLMAKARAENRKIIHGFQILPRVQYSAAAFPEEFDLVISYPHLQFYAQSPQEFSNNFRTEKGVRDLFAFDLTTVRLCQSRAKSPTNFAALMRNLGLKIPLFHSALHPGGYLTSRLLADFARQIPGVDQHLIDHVALRVSAGEGINFVSCHAVPASVQAEFRAEWVAPYPFYAELLSKTASGEWDWIIANWENAEAIFPHDTQTWNALSLASMAINDRDKALPALNRLLALSPGYPEFWRRAFEFSLRHDDDAGFSTLAGRAKVFFGGQRQFDSIMTNALVERSRWVEAEYYARRYLELTPERYEGLVPLLTVLTRSGRITEAQHIGVEAMRHCDPSRLGELQTCLAGIQDVDWRTHNHWAA